MNSKARIALALGCRQPDRVPVSDAFDWPIVLQLAAMLGIEPLAGGPPADATEAAIAAFEFEYNVLDRLGLDSLVTGVSTGRERSGEGRFRDRFGCTFAETPHGDAMVLEGVVHSHADLPGLDMASRLEPRDFFLLRHAIASHGDDKAVFLALNDPFRLAWTLRGGMSNLLIDYIIDPEMAHRLTRIGADYNLAILRESLAQGVQFVFMGGDLASERTTLMSPRHYREYIKPYHKELVDCAHSGGARFVKHTDGNLWPILDDFVEIGFDGFHPIQPQCMDIAEVKQHLAGKMCCLGNIDCRDLLVFGTPEQVERSVKETIAIAAPGGGYILGSSNSVHAGCKPENVIAMYRAAKEYGVYELAAQ